MAGCDVGPLAPTAGHPPARETINENAIFVIVDDYTSLERHASWKTCRACLYYLELNMSDTYSPGFPGKHVL